MRVGMTYRFSEEETPFRVVDVREGLVHYVGILEDRGYSVKSIDAEGFFELLASGGIVEAEDPFLFPSHPDTLPEKTRLKAEENWRLVSELWETRRDEILDKRTRAATMREFAKSKGVSFIAVRRLLTDFFERGMREDSVVPKYYECGASGKRRRPAVKPGPKGHMGSPTTAEAEPIFRQAYRKYYLKKKRKERSVVFAWEMMVGEHYMKDGKLDYDSAPTYLQFYRWVQRQDKEAALSSASSQSFFDANHRILTSSTNAEVEGPGDVFEIDASPIDCHIVSRSNRNKVIGRPVIYLVVDRYSRLVVGMSVGLHEPSWVGAMGALENMVADKVEFCAERGIEIGDEEWPAKGRVPYSIVGDRGEMICEDSSQIVETFRTAVKNAAPYRGDCKGNVERTFGPINKKIRTLLDGAVLKEAGKRGQPDPRDWAKLNIDEMTRACIHCVLKHNAHLIDGFPLSEDQIAYGVPAVPIKLWRYGVDHYLDSLYPVDPEGFREKLLPSVMPTVGRRGIEFNGFVYTSTDPWTKNWLLNHKNTKQEFAYDPLDVSYGILRTPDGDIRLTLSNTFDSYRGMGYEEAMAYRKQAGSLREEYAPTDLENRIKLNEKLTEINDSVQGPDGTVTKAERKKDIKKNRKEERIAIDRERVGGGDRPEAAPERTRDPLVDNYDYIQKALEESEYGKE